MRIDSAAGGSAWGSGVHINNVLQAKWEPAFSDVVRVTTNSVLGFGGVFDIASEKLTAIVNTGSVPPPLFNHSAILVDLDIYRDVDVPQKDGDIWALVDVLRSEKNRIFETGSRKFVCNSQILCITEYSGLTTRTTL